jgi:hypothetical protein
MLKHPDPFIQTLRRWLAAVAIGVPAAIFFLAAALAQTTTSSEGPGMLSQNGTVTEPFRLGTVTIANGASLSGSVDMGAARLVGIIMPASWTAAGLTFQCSSDNSTFYNMYDETGAELTWTVAASTYVTANFPTRWLACRYLKIRSGTSSVAVNQGAARTLTVVSAP